jgi:hypothetical protein
MDQYYQNFGPIYHLRYGAEFGIVKKTEFSSISDPHLATHFATQGNAGGGLRNYDRSGSQAIAGLDQAQADADAAEEAEEEAQNNPPDPQGQGIEAEEANLTLREQAEQRQREATNSAYASIANVDTVALFNQIKLTLVGNSLFKNGNYFYFDPKLPGMTAALMDGNTMLETLNIGGYYVVTKTIGKVDSKNYETQVEAYFEGRANFHGEGATDQSETD